MALNNAIDHSMARHKWVVWSCITHQTYGVSACFKHILALIFKALAVVRRTPGVPSRPFTPRSQVERWIRHGLEHPPIKMDDFPRKPPFNRGISQPASGLCLMKPEGSIFWGRIIHTSYLKVKWSHFWENTIHSPTILKVSPFGHLAFDPLANITRRVLW